MRYNAPDQCECRLGARLATVRMEVALSQTGKKSVLEISRQRCSLSHLFYRVRFVLPHKHTKSFFLVCRPLKQEMLVVLCWWWRWWWWWWCVNVSRLVQPKHSFLMCSLLHSDWLIHTCAHKFWCVCFSLCVRILVNVQIYDSQHKTICWIYTIKTFSVE